MRVAAKQKEETRIARADGTAAAGPGVGVRVAGRVPMMAVGAIALVAAMWVGVARMGWRLPQLSATLVAQHGPLMIGGFLGTLIGLERAVGLGRRWAYAAPGLASLATAGLLAGAPARAVALPLSAASGVLVAIFVAIYRVRPNRAHGTMAVAAAAWLAGNLSWLAGMPVPHLVPWWAGFLVLTIAGERLELAHVVTGNPATDRTFLGASVALVLGLVVSVLHLQAGVAVAGMGMAAIAVWLVRHDVAWRTVRQRGLTRYIAWCLLPGYFWLLVGGALWAALAPQFGAGVYYDAMLHAVFLGFVMSMIFGHAPVIVPAVLGVPIPYTPRLYAPLVLLHASLVLRVAGDVTVALGARRWGGLLNVAAVLLFLAVAVTAARKAGRGRPAGPTGSTPAGARAATRCPCRWWAA